MLRMHGDLLPIKFRDVRAAELEGYISEILTRSQSEQFNKGIDLDFSYVSGEGGRFRVNVYRKETGIGATFRSIPAAVPTLEKLALPPIVTKLCDFHQGMVLVTGSTGTGKSTLLAVVTQVLVKTSDNHGRKAICEVLMMTKAVAKLIQTEQTHQIPTQMQMGRDLGMQLLNQALLAAINQRSIDPDDAYNFAADKRAFQKFVT